VRVGSDDVVTVILPQAEMGQGVYTSLPMLVAEELEVVLDRMRVEHAHGSDQLYANPNLRIQMTGSSSSVRAFYQPMRRAGATARTMLIAAAAQEWGVDPATCHAEKGTVVHAPSGRSETYGKLADRAATLPVPDNVVLKDPKSFSLIGTPAKRLDTPAKVNGTAQFGGVVARDDGDVIAATTRSARRIEATYHQPFLAHAAMEPLSCTVRVRPDACEVWCGSQVQGRAQATAAEVTGLPLEKVIVHNLFLGGGFGRRLEHDYVPQAVRIARQVEGPVKVVWTREEDVQHDVYRPYYVDRIVAGLDARGRPVAWSHRVVGSSILAHFLPNAFKNGLDGDAVDGSKQLLYDIPAIRVEYVQHEEPVLRTTWWRGVGVTHNCFVVESFFDEIAAASKRDPVDLRRDLLRKSPRGLAVLRPRRDEGWMGRPASTGPWSRRFVHVQSMGHLRGDGGRRGGSRQRRHPR